MRWATKYWIYFFLWAGILTPEYGIDYWAVQVHAILGLIAFVFDMITHGSVEK